MDKPSKQTPQEKDKHLDIPSEANTEEHINFLEVEEAGDTRKDKDNKELEERQKQWKEGLEEGRGEKRNNP